MIDVEAEIAALRAEVAQLRAEFLQGQTAATDDGLGGGEGCDVGLPLVPIGGGGTHMGNTEESEEIDGDIIFESAEDSNVEVATEKRTEGDEEVNVIKIGVYYV